MSDGPHKLQVRSPSSSMTATVKENSLYSSEPVDDHSALQEQQASQASGYDYCVPNKKAHELEKVGFCCQEENGFLSKLPIFL